VRDHFTRETHAFKRNWMDQQKSEGKIVPIKSSGSVVWIVNFDLDEKKNTLLENSVKTFEGKV
jgi:hypothetical protein